MTALIEKLRAEHDAIARLLARVREEGAGSGEGRRLLEQLRVTLEGHFAGEEQQLFPALRAAADHAPRLKAAVEHLAREAIELTGETAGFFVRAREGASGLELARRFGRLYATLGERMRREEESLFPALDRSASRTDRTAS